MKKLWKWFIDFFAEPLPYTVIQVNPEHGTEIRMTHDRGRIWVHVNDEEKYKIFLNKLMTVVHEDLESQK